MVISMLKIRRPLGRLIFNMGIALPGKTVFLIETTPGVTKPISHFPVFSQTSFSELFKDLLQVEYRKVSNIRRTKSQNFNASRLIL